MDQLTHNVRRAQWIGIINACQSRPEGTTVKAWLATNNVKEKAYYYWLRKFRREAYAKLKTESCEQLPGSSTSFTEIPVPETLTRAEDMSFSFTPDAIIKTEDYVIALSNSISGSLLNGIMEGLNHAR